MKQDISKFDHVEPGELVDYFVSRLALDRERAIEEHITVCGTCAEYGRSVYTLVFDVQRLTARHLAQAFAKQAVASALASVAELESNASLKPMYDQWLRGLGRATVGGLKTIVRSSGAEFLIEGIHSVGGWKMSPAYALRSASPGDRPVASKVSLEVPGGNLRSVVSVGLQGDSVVIKIADWPRGTVPLAILVNLQQPGTPIPGQRTPVAEGQYEIGFHGVQSGPYILLFASMEKGQPTS